MFNKHKNHFWKITTVTLAALTVLLIGTITSVDSIGSETALAQNTGNELVCKGGGRDYATFVASLIDWEGFYEDWKDILVRYNGNICLFNDIDSVLTQLDMARKQVRNAFYTCNPNAGALKTNYYKLLAKVYFLRNFMKVDNDQIIFVPDNTVLQKMKNYLVINKGIYTNDQVKALYDDFKAQYKSDEDHYLSCPNQSWGAIVSKWNEMKDIITQTGKSFSKDIKQNFDRAWNEPITRSGNLLWGFLDARINDLPPGETWDQIKEQLTKNLPNGYSIDTEIQAHTGSDIKQAQVKEEFDYITQYQFLYQQNSAESTKELVEKLKKLQTTITDTYPWIDKSFKCVKRLVDKAC